MIPTPRDQIKGMAPAEAIEHLLYLLESFTGTRQDIVDAILDKKLPPALARIYTALRKGGDRGVSYEALQIFGAKSMEGGISRTCLTAQICYLRRALPANEKIINIREYGFKLIIK